MTDFDTQLRERFHAAGADLGQPAERLDEVRRHGRQRRRVQRVVVGFGAAAVLIGGGSLVTTSMLEQDAPERPIVDEPDPQPSVDDPEPTPGGDDDGLDSVSVEELPWETSVYGPDGIVRHRGASTERLADEAYEHAFALSDGSVVAQTRLGAAIVHLVEPDEGDGARTEQVIEPGDDALLLRVTGTDATDAVVWWSVRAGGTEDGPDQQVWRRPLTGGQPEQITTVGAVESGTQALEVVGDALYYQSCHLQCTVMREPIGGGDAEPVHEQADWQDWLDVDPDGRRLAFVAYEVDPELGEPVSGELVVLDLTANGAEIARVPLPGLAGWNHNVAFTPEGSAVAVGSLDGPGWLVEDDGATLRRLREPGLIAFHGPWLAAG